jgi:hypothetical protein
MEKKRRKTEARKKRRKTESRQDTPKTSLYLISTSAAIRRHQSAAITKSLIRRRSRLFHHPSSRSHSSLLSHLISSQKKQTSLRPTTTQIQQTMRSKIVQTSSRIIGISMVANLFLLGRLTSTCSFQFQFQFQSRAAILRTSQCCSSSNSMPVRRQTRRSRSTLLFGNTNPANNDSKKSTSVFHLLNGVLSRAERTLSYKSNTENKGDLDESVETVEEVLEPPAYADTEIVNDAIQDVLSSVQQDVAVAVGVATPTPTPSRAPAPITPAPTIPPTPAPDVLPRPTDVGLNYGSNPTISSVALAHSLWSYVLRPGMDSAIDATAGNGGDSTKLAQMLFSPNTTSTTDTAAPQGSSNLSQLVCIDITSDACEKTRQRLASLLPDEILQQNVQILHQSHAPLAVPLTPDNVLCTVALVVYNLGFLPQSQADSRDGTRTTTESTIASMADALLMIRVGGLLSVMTYPRTNVQEDYAVHAFLEGLALFTSTQVNWETFIDDDLDCSESLRELLKTTLQRVRSQGDGHQTWRVHEHKKMGWIDAPILLTATRIK